MIILIKATSVDAPELHALQIKSFLPLLAKYNDVETNPAVELLEKTLNRINNPKKGFYKILKDGLLVGGIAIKKSAPNILFIGPIFIDPDFQNQKIAQKALTLLETLFPKIEYFELATIKEEKGNMHLYEKMGYVLTGETKKINHLDIPFFRKKLRV